MKNEKLEITKSVYSSRVEFSVIIDKKEITENVYFYENDFESKMKNAVNELCQKIENYKKAKEFNFIEFLGVQNEK